MLSIFSEFTKNSIILIQLFLITLTYTSFLQANLTNSPKLKRKKLNSFQNNKNILDCKSCQKKNELFLDKPNRTHHCRLCNFCILKMDHHCPFVGNCLGISNYRYYYQLLFYGSFFLLFSCVIYCFNIYYRFGNLFRDWNKNKRDFFKIFDMVFWVLPLVLCFIGFLPTFGLFCNHTFLILKNCSTLENMGREEYSFSFGKISNLKKIFGSYIYFFFPIKKKYKYEGYFFFKRLEDPEFNQNEYEVFDFKESFYKKKDLLTINDIIEKIENKENKEIIS